MADFDSAAAMLSEKARIRKNIRAVLRQQSPQWRDSNSRQIGEFARNVTAYQQAGTVFCYLAMDYEVQTEFMIDACLRDGKRVVVPRVNPESDLLECRLFRRDALRAGPYGILEPDPQTCAAVDPKGIDLAWVPGLAFDPDGNRLGQGGGYFDDWLRLLAKGAATVGLAFQNQIMNRVPVAAHDQPVRGVITEAGWIKKL